MWGLLQELRALGLRVAGIILLRVEGVTCASCSPHGAQENVTKVDEQSKICLLGLVPGLNYDVPADGQILHHR